ncbi:MAG: dehypoxanthine futalosine cyclase, partial [Gemmatimonadota bacterium]
MVETLRAKIAAGERLGPSDGEAMLTTIGLTELGVLANRERFRRHPKREVTYVIDSNPNYSNICNIDCVFCAFYRHEDEPGAYTHAVDEVLEQ